ncbi:HDOD domain-containing protein [Aquincola sp. S2]|uniref:HDOD domain-containing protein n=1 Tax=Pseudaquabacterium terrae TaxID=2732868 RepID=A0ABX2EJE4_9BURK|nr:HDOD domain-containing protein [Aquabacterium terrae]NRF68701.1 HDOD domain-containing protein [Aquabacterium terrae]
MLRSWFDRLLGRAPAPPPPRGARREVAAPRATAAAPMLPAAVGAHRPLVSAQGGIAGFEFRIADAALQRLRGRADPAAASAGTAALLAAMRLTAQRGQVAFCELPLVWLVRAGDDARLQAGMQIALAPADAEDAAIEGLPTLISGWRASGAAIGWRPDAAPAGLGADARPDFVLLQSDGATAALVDSLRSWRARQPALPLIVLDLPGLDALEAVLLAGAALAGCAIDGAGEPKEARALPAQTQQLLRLMNQLAQDADTAEVVKAIKADVGLSYRLLRQLNSAALSPGGAELGSIEQAVALLGRNELYRWVSVLLVRQAPARPVSSALQSMALARARFFELLAESRGETPAGALFTLGLASMLPQLLQTRLVDALASLQLHRQAAAALLERQGPWVEYLTLAEVLDEGDLVEAAEMAAAYGGLPQVLLLSAKAWLFASSAGKPPV